MKTLLRHLLPHVLVRSAAIAGQLQTLGLPRSRAWRLSAERLTLLRMHELNLPLLPPGALHDLDCVMDLGANVGDWTAHLLHFCTPRRLICVEPDPKLAAGLRERFRPWPLVEVKQVGVGATAGKAEFKIMEASTLNSFRTPCASIEGVHPGAFAVKETVQVDVSPLDALAPAEGRISLLKIDTQGFEREVLAGAAATLARTDHVLMEMNFRPHYEGEADFHELDGIMHRHGFCIGNYSPPKGGTRQVLYADVLYVRQDS